MKFGFKIGSVNIAGVEVKDIELTSEYTTKEFVDLMYAGKELAKEISMESPEFFMELEKVYDRVNKASEEETKVEKVEPSIEEKLNFSARDLISYLLTK